MNNKPKFFFRADYMFPYTCEVCMRQKRVRYDQLKTKLWPLVCGDCRRIQSGRNNQTHGHAGKRWSKTYQTWTAMKSRCSNPNDDHWEQYGGRGITVCEDWRTFEGFLRDMGERPAMRTLDRIDVDGNYEPSNCRWATVAEQNLNRRATEKRKRQWTEASRKRWAR